MIHRITDTVIKGNKKISIPITVVHYAIDFVYVSHAWMKSCLARASSANGDSTSEQNISSSNNGNDDYEDNS